MGNQPIISTKYKYVVAWAVIFLIGASNLYSFSVFEGFSTFANDSFHYLLTARKWSPWFEPNQAELLTTPLTALPPGFSFLLAMTGASETTFTSHLLVYACAVLGITLASWFVLVRFDWTPGTLYILSLWTLPGFVVSSMGILSENAYICFSLGAVIAFYGFLTKSSSDRHSFLILFLCLAFAALTRTIGVSLIISVIIVALTHKTIEYKKRILLIAIASLSVLTLIIWGAFELITIDGGISYTALYSEVIGSDSFSILKTIEKFKDIVLLNLIGIPSAWVQYLSLNKSGPFQFTFGIGIFGFCLIATILRALKLKLDAVYIIIYLLILLVWPWSTELMRFLHAIVFLMLAQPLLYVGELESKATQLFSFVVSILFIILIGQSISIQWDLRNLKTIAEEQYFDISHSFEFYAGLGSDAAFKRSFTNQIVMKSIKDSSKFIETSEVVAAVKPTAFAVIAEREAVALSTRFSYSQQLCNFKIKDVDYAFISPITTRYNRSGSNLADTYREVSSIIRTSNPHSLFIHLVRIDKSLLDDKLMALGPNCNRFRAIL